MLSLPQPTRRYRNAVFDNARWAAFRPRPGDVVVIAPPKCGTTWTTKLAAMLLHDTPDLPRPLGRMVRWLDLTAAPLERVIAELEAQPGPRVIKTHTPGDGLPWFPEVRYVFCGRDPRDAFFSILDHVRNTRDSRSSGVPQGARLDPNALFPRWATQGQFPWMYDGAPFQSVVWYTESWGRHRGLPNLHFTHYRDLSLDLEGELRRLAAFLDRPVDEARWPLFVAAGSFAQMKAAADDNAPGADRGTWHSNADFFREGRLDAWRTGLSPENQALYEAVNAERLKPELKAWMEGGRRAVA
jgi:hypothetical protein